MTPRSTSDMSSTMSVESDSGEGEHDDAVVHSNAYGGDTEYKPTSLAMGSMDMAADLDAILEDVISNSKRAKAGQFCK